MGIVCIDARMLDVYGPFMFLKLVKFSANLVQWYAIVISAHVILARITSAKILAEVTRAEMTQAEITLSSS